ncbi:MAG: AAA family ATPase, partial [Acidobacteria bacterium]|nr:AAA family ATPase [Acidobacteriota bacterium]
DSQFVVLPLQEVSLSSMLPLLEEWRGHEEERSGRRFSPDALEEAVHLTHRFLPRGTFPRKALDLLDSVLAGSGAKGLIEGADVRARFTRLHRVPPLLVDPALPLHLDALEDDFASRVLGQQEAVRVVVRMMGLIKAGLSDLRRPFGVFLFVGPTGVGKTHLAQLLGETLFGSRERLVRLNMADYPSPESAGVLFGDASSRTIAGQRGVLTQRVSGQPFAVLLLDEFEKAHDTVHDRFLQLFDEGSFINGSGETVSCRSMILIATSNAGAEAYLEEGRLGFFAPQGVDALTHDVEHRLSKRFRPEFLNRFDQVVHFRPLARSDVRTIARRELVELATRSGLSRHGVTLEADEAVVDWLAAHGYDPRYGARFLRRALERHVTSALAAVLVSGPPERGSTIRLLVRKGRVEAVRVTIPKATAAEARDARAEAPPQKARNREALLREARVLLEASRLRLADLAERKERASHLLVLMNEPDFFTHGAESEKLLDEYRALDVAIATDARDAAALFALEGLATPSSDARALARALDEAAASLASWDLRLAAEGPRRTWLFLQWGDALVPASRFLFDLAAMELAWAKSLGLAASLAAWESYGDELASVVLAVEGPGAAAWLGMEDGLHRLVRGKAGDLKVRVASVPWRDSGDAAAVSAARHREGPFGANGRYRVRVAMPSRGSTLDLFGEESAILGAVARDLAHWGAGEPQDSSETSRLYGADGAGARDPRTGAVIARLKDVFSGRLRPLLDAWRLAGRVRALE